MRAFRRWLPLLAALPSVGCASAGGRLPPPPPHTLVITSTLDRARALVRTALTEEALPIDGAPAADSDVISSTFLVRRGGMGESEIVVRLRLRPAPDSGDGSPGVHLQLEATARERNRMAIMSAEDARSPRPGREPHPVADNDRETLQRIQRLLDRLQRGGWTPVTARNTVRHTYRLDLAPRHESSLRWRSPSSAAE